MIQFDLIRLAQAEDRAYHAHLNPELNAEIDMISGKLHTYFNLTKEALKGLIIQQLPSISNELNSIRGIKFSPYTNSIPNPTEFLRFKEALFHILYTCLENTCLSE